MGRQRRTARFAGPAALVVAAVVVVACSAPAGAGSNASGSAAGGSTASPAPAGGAAGSPAPSAAAAGSFVLPSIDLSEPTQGPMSAGSYTVTLTGKWPGAGSYSGSGAILCSSVPGSNQWTVAANFPSGGVNQIGVLQQPGHSSITISTPANQENSPWFASETTPGATVSISGTPSGANVVIHATGTWSDMENSYSIDLTVTCTPLR